MSVGSYIKSLRIEKGLTQEELGKLLGVKRAAVQKWESGLVKNLKRTTIQQMAEIFNVSPVSFICENHETNSPEKSEELEEGIILHRNGKTSTYRLSKEKLKTIEALLNQLDEDDNPDL